MYRLFVVGLICIVCVASKASSVPDGSAQWVSCFADPPSNDWRGPKTVITPTIKSFDGRQRAYATIEAQASGPANCHNTVRLFVSPEPQASFQQVYVQKASSLSGTANSLGVIAWSPNGRWLLVERGDWFYASDAGGLDILLYDAQSRKVTVPNLKQMLKRKLQKSCAIRLGEEMAFDASSRIHLQLADFAEEGEDAPQTQCFRGVEEWVLSPSEGTMRPSVRNGRALK